MKKRIAFTVAVLWLMMAGGAGMSCPFSVGPEPSRLTLECEGVGLAEAPGLVFANDVFAPCICRYFGDETDLPTFEESLAWAMAQVEERHLCEEQIPPASASMGECNGGALRYIDVSYGFSGTTRYFDADTGRLVGMTISSDVGPCNNIYHLVERIECDDATKTADLCPGQ